MPWHDVVLPVALQRYIDLPPVALRQRELALALAPAARVHVVSVDAPVALLPGLEDTPSKLARFVAPLREAGCDVRAAHRSGHPAREVLELVAAVGADLVVAGSHSKRGPFDVGLGGTAAELLRRAACTVVLVRPSTAEAARARELMIPSYPFVFPYP